MKRFILLFLTIFIFGCTATIIRDEDVQKDQILPTTIGSIYEYNFTKFDTLENISETGIIVYDMINTKLINDSTLIYAYNKDFSGEGIYVSNYRGSSRSQGLYVYGKFKKGSEIFQDSTYYQQPTLWFKYPAIVGDKWKYEDTSGVKIEYEVISTDEEYFIPNNDDNFISPIKKLKCYKYLEKKSPNKKIYHYLSPGVGRVGYEEYENGKLRVLFKLSRESSII
jgi:hypothetical protein